MLIALIRAVHELPSNNIGLLLLNFLAVAKSFEIEFLKYNTEKGLGHKSFYFSNVYYLLTCCCQ
jgi:hypothetical protein